jgi:hypothetical protein
VEVIRGSLQHSKQEEWRHKITAEPTNIAGRSRAGKLETGCRRSCSHGNFVATDAQPSGEPAQDSMPPNFVFFLGEGVRADEFSSSVIEGWDGDGLSAMGNRVFPRHISTESARKGLFSGGQDGPERGHCPNRAYYLEPEEFEFYDLQSDPGELHNLYGNAAHDPLIEQLLQRIAELRRDTGDSFNYEAPAGEPHGSSLAGGA